MWRFAPANGNRGSGAISLIASALGTGALPVRTIPYEMFRFERGLRPRHSARGEVRKGGGSPPPRMLVGSGTDLLVELLELVRGEAGRLARGDDLPLVGFHFGDGVGNAASDVVRDRHHAVLVEVDEIAGLDPHAADLHGNAEVDHVDVGVRHRDVRGRELELERPDLVEVAHGA